MDIILLDEGLKTRVWFHLEAGSASVMLVRRHQKAAAEAPKGWQPPYSQGMKYP